MDVVLLSLPPLFLLLYTITKHLLHKLLNLPPTPFPIIPLIGHLYFFTNPTLPFHRALSRVSRRHGPALFLHLGSRPALLISSPSAAQQCLAQNDVVFANRPNLLNGKHFGYNFTSLAWASYGDHWRNLRRVSALNLLSAHKLHALSAVRADEARALVRKIVKNSSIDEAVEMKTLLFEHAYKVVAAMIAGRAGAAEGEEAEAFYEIVAEMAAATLEANVVDFLPFLGWLGFGDVERKMRLVQEKRDRFMENVIGKYRSDGEDVCCNGKQRNLIGILMDLQRAEPEYYTDEMIRNLLLVLIHGATHTTATTLEWAFSLLLENQNILARVRGEIDNLVGKRRLLGESDLSKLPYLGCIINETLRMHPVAPLLTPHVSSDECCVEGFRIPRGTILLVNAWEIHNNPKTWEDPDKFVPERFEGGKNIFEFEFKFLPFGWGRRACPGQRLAIEMVGVALGCLIQCFEWEKIGEIDMKEGKGVITPRVQPVRAKLIPRPFLSSLLS